MNTPEKEHKIPRHIEIEPDEKVILHLRQHWSIFRNSLLLIFFLPTLSLYGIFIINTTGYLNFSLLKEALLGASLMSFLGGLGVLFWNYYHWKRTVYLVTDKRVIVVVQEGPFSRRIQQAPNQKIMNVTARVEGLSANLYGYGDVLVEVLLPGREKAIEFKRVGNPHKVQHEIMRLSLSKNFEKKTDDVEVFEL